ncbi:hypothetical protein CCMSSC00406_0007080 [Pleurotus cornucopiae]|uniref:Uncharacterized protein n=1 Tax=Pleurotus cornucopiae TaxID=5321 RepID=A0ACB7J617_PLECO|nr:hypothetical protein CCMSSC00406_0007080 [Pleurotus cornucopiae]
MAMAHLEAESGSKEDRRLKLKESYEVDDHQGTKTPAIALGFLHASMPLFLPPTNAMHHASWVRRSVVFVTRSTNAVVPSPVSRQTPSDGGHVCDLLLERPASVEVEVDPQARAGFRGRRSQGPFGLGKAHRHMDMTWRADF